MKRRRPQPLASSVLIFRGLTLYLAFGFISGLTGCGGKSAYTVPPIQLSVSLNPTVSITSNATPIGVQVMIMAPTETATFSLIGLPSGLSWSYKESESNPSGLLTLTAAKTTVAGTYKSTITVGSSGQTATTTFNLVVSAPTQAGNSSDLRSN